MQSAIRLAVLALLCGAAYAQGAETKGSQGGAATKTAAGAKKSVTRPKGLPDAAVEVAPGIWRNVGRDGKVLFYRHTPFGFTISEKGPDFAAESVAAPADVTVVDLGDTLQFSRKSPFGVNRWTRKKSELDDFERAIWERSQDNAGAPSGQTAAQGQNR